MKPILSIVIPVYNVAAYIEKCVASCFKQNVSDDLFEIILVNDGSTDNSLELCEELKIDYPKIEIVSQKNKGLSGARNTGLRNAIGDYVWFVDSDDWIEENCINRIIQKLNNKVDILWLGHDVWHNGESIKDYIPKETSNSITGSELFTSHLNNLFYIWKFIYNREFLNSNSLTFLEGILYEDLEFTPRALIKADKCHTLPHVYYHYLVREGSIANNIKLKNIEHRFFILNKLIDLLDDKEVNEIYLNSLSKVIIFTAEGTINMAARAGIKIPDNGIKLISNIRDNGPFFKNLSLKQKIIKSNPKLYYNLFKLTHTVYKMVNTKK